MKKHARETTISRKEGFSLLELIMVMIIMGITLAVAIPKFTGKSSVELQVVARQVQSDIRYTQELAMSKHSKSSIAFTSGHKDYSITCSNFSKSKTLPDHAKAEFDPDSTALTFKFNSLGEPVVGAGKKLRISVEEEYIDIVVETITGRAIIK